MASSHTIVSDPFTDTLIRIKARQLCRRQDVEPAHGAAADAPSGAAAPGGHIEAVVQALVGQSPRRDQHNVHAGHQQGGRAFANSLMPGGFGHKTGAGGDELTEAVDDQNFAGEAAPERLQRLSGPPAGALARQADQNLQRCALAGKAGERLPNDCAVADYPESQRASPACYARRRLSQH